MTDPMITGTESVKIVGLTVLVVLCTCVSPKTLAQTITAQDGPVSVTYGDVYQRGSIKIEPYDLTTLPPLPEGYAALNNKGYLITTTAVVSGPHVFHFRASSVTKETEFKNLRIFHAEPDTFDPDSPVWVDRTILSAEADSPNFSTGAINASSEELGVFVIARLVREVPPSTAVADLAVTCNGSADQVTAPNNVTYTVKVTNKGPQTATNIGVIDGYPNDGLFISATASQGSCKEKTGSLYCKLGTLPSGNSATITVVVKPYEGTGSFPAEGKMTANHAWVAANEEDSDPDNNHVAEMTLLLPDPNLPPIVSLDSPKMGTLLVGPADIKISGIASDTDGIVSKVEVFDNGKPIGTGTRVGENRFVLTEQGVTFGPHVFFAVATDNNGRQNISNSMFVIVNGSAVVSIVSPKDGSLVEPGSSVTISANVSHPSGVINKVEFFAHGESLGEATPAGINQYELRLKKVERAIYQIVAVATDGSGVTTTSATTTMTVSKRPTVSILSPSEGTRFPSPTNLSVLAQAIQPGDYVRKVDFYANDVLIGSASDIATERFRLTWRNVQEGVYSLTAVATDELGVTGKSPPVKIVLDSTSPKP
ncbi:MAG: Ig-like domain-containing protein [Pyrinomonadaceae bacterium]